MLLSLFLLVLGLFGTLAGVMLLLKSMQCRHWPTVPGQLLEKNIGPSTTTSASHAGRYYEPVVKYSYVINGKKYTSERMGLIKTAYNLDSARNRINKLVQQLQVYYNPENPAEAYLRPTAYSAALVALIFGLFSLAVGVGRLVI